MKKDKRALTLNALYPAVLVIVLVGIVLGIGLYVMDQVRDNVATGQTGLDVNQNTTSATNTTTLGDSTNTNYKLITVDSVIWANGTGSTITNYTSTESGVITWGDDLSLQSDLVNISSTYTYDVADSPELAISTASTGLGTLADWIAIIVVVLAAAVVLGVVLSSFGREPGV